MLSAGSSKETGRRETPGRQNMLRTNPPGGMRRAKKPRCLNSCHDIRSGKNGFQRVRPRRKPGQTRRKTFRQADSGTSKTPRELNASPLAAERKQSGTARRETVRTNTEKETPGKRDEKNARRKNAAEPRFGAESLFKGFALT